MSKIIKCSMYLVDIMIYATAQGRVRWQEKSGMEVKMKGNKKGKSSGVGNMRRRRHWLGEHCRSSGSLYQDKGGFFMDLLESNSARVGRKHIEPPWENSTQNALHREEGPGRTEGPVSALPLPCKAFHLSRPQSPQGSVGIRKGPWPPALLPVSTIKCTQCTTGTQLGKQHGCSGLPIFKWWSFSFGSKRIIVLYLCLFSLLLALVEIQALALTLTMPGYSKSQEQVSVKPPAVCQGLF